MRTHNPSMSIAASYGLGSTMPSQIGSELHAAGGSGLEDETTGKFWHPNSPLFWVGAILAATFGLAAISTSGSVRVGPIHASAAAGAGK